MTINLKNFRLFFNVYLILYFLYISVLSLIMLFIFKKKWLVNNFKVNNKGTVKAQFKNKVILAEFIQIKNHYLVYLCRKKTNL